MSLADATDWATIVGVFVALGTLLKGLHEYVKQGAQKRTEFFWKIWQRLKDVPERKQICDAIDDDNFSLLATIPHTQKRDLLGLFEEVALLVNSKLMRPEVAYYMFGYYAIRCWESDDFWKNVPKGRDEKYWKLLKLFVEQMKQIEKTPWEKRKKTL